MASPADTHAVYLEVGTKRTLAGALAWPGWCRVGRDEPAALQALAAYGPRYARVLQAAGIDFRPPAGAAGLIVVERLAGNASTDFGIPGTIPPSDRQPADAAEVERLQALLRACWQAFDAAVRAAAGRQLRTGPRGGGRDLAGIVQHVAGADQAYLRRLVWPFRHQEVAGPDELHRHIRQSMLTALAAAARGELPTQGPRGGAVWPPRFFARYVAWHALDHAWEIEDRVI
jgi:hypothetical protein